MRKVIIDRKEYFQQEEEDIDKLPKMEISKDILSKYNYDDLVKNLDKPSKSNDNAT